jgi:hypothetical protein
MWRLIPLPEFWHDSELIIASKDCVPSVAEYFSGRVEIVADRDDLLQKLKVISDRTYSVIGLALSLPSVALATDREVITMLRRIVRERLLILTESSEAARVFPREIMHAIGFYEIAQVFSTPDEIVLDYSSVSGDPCGSADRRSLHPNGARIPEPLISAGRTALTDPSRYDWRHEGNVLFTDSNGRFVAEASERIGLAVRLENRHEFEDRENFLQRVRAEVSWRPDGACNAFAGLVGSYHGPGDTNMYLSMLEVYNKGFVQVSLWRYSGDWERLAVAKPETEGVAEKSSNGEWKTDMLFTLTDETLEITLHDKTMIRIYDTLLPRRFGFGVRMRGDRFAVSEVEGVCNVDG